MRLTFSVLGVLFAQLVIINQDVSCQVVTTTPMTTTESSTMLTTQTTDNVATNTTTNDFDKLIKPLLTLPPKYPPPSAYYPVPVYYPVSPAVAPPNPVPNYPPPAPVASYPAPPPFITYPHPPPVVSYPVPAPLPAPAISYAPPPPVSYPPALQPAPYYSYSPYYSYPYYAHRDPSTENQAPKQPDNVLRTVDIESERIIILQPQQLSNSSANTTATYIYVKHPFRRFSKWQNQNTKNANPSKNNFSHLNRNLTVPKFIIQTLNGTSGTADNSDTLGNFVNSNGVLIKHIEEDIEEETASETQKSTISI